MSQHLVSTIDKKQVRFKTFLSDRGENSFEIGKRIGEWLNSVSLNETRRKEIIFQRVVCINHKMMDLSNGLFSIGSQLFEEFLAKS